MGEPIRDRTCATHNNKPSCTQPPATPTSNATTSYRSIFTDSSIERINKWIMIAWLVVLYLFFEFGGALKATPRRTMPKMTLPEAIAAQDPTSIYQLTVEGLKSAPKPQSVLSKYLNDAQYNPQGFRAVLDAYFDAVLLKEWKTEPAPAEYTGPFGKSSDIPSKFYSVTPYSDAAPEDAAKKGRRDGLSVRIVGRSKSPGSYPVHVTIDDRSKGRRVSMNIGEDAVGVSQDARLFVVADGVGGALHSETVSLALTHLVLRLHEHSLLVPDLLSASEKLIRALQMFLHRFQLTGSTTLLIAHYDDRSGNLDIVNIGDCQAMVVATAAATDGDQPDVLATSRIAFLSEEQWWAPNMPYQLSSSIEHFPPQLAARYRMKLRHNTNSGDISGNCSDNGKNDSKMAMTRLWLYSDGIGDNVWPRQIAWVRTAEGLLKLALRQANGAIKTDIPFSQKMGFETNGKIDDMSIIAIDIPTS